MSLDGVRDSGVRVVGEVRRFYREADRLLAERAPLGPEEQSWLEELLTPALEASEEVRREAEDALTPIPRGGEYESISAAVLATAALDAMLASDLAVWDSEQEWREYLGEEPAPDSEQIARARDETLRSAERALGEASASAGSAAMDPSREASIIRAVETTATLVNLAAAPSRNLTAGLVTVSSGGVMDLLAAAERVDPVPGLQTVSSCLRKRAPRFLREHVAKVVALRADARVVTEVAHRLKGLRRRMRVEELLVQIAATRRADASVEETILQASLFPQKSAEDLNSDLLVLTRSYREQTELIGKSARWLRWGAAPLAHLVAPIVGHAVAAAVFLAGLGYVAYSLTDRIDARDLGIADRVEGVVHLVEKRA